MQIIWMNCFDGETFPSAASKIFSSLRPEFIPQISHIQRENAISARKFRCKMYIATFATSTQVDKIKIKFSPFNGSRKIYFHGN